jgi:hypothetical protein
MPVTNQTARKTDRTSWRDMTDHPHGTAGAGNR